MMISLFLWLRARAHVNALVGLICGLLLAFPQVVYAQTEREGFPSQHPVTSQVGNRVDRAADPGSSFPLAWNWKTYFRGNMDRARIVQICVVCMALGLFILMKKLALVEGPSP
jgi:hypothetical protein